MPRGRAAVGALLAAATLTAAVRAVPFADAASVRPQSVAPVGAEAFPNEQATDRQGDTAF